MTTTTWDEIDGFTSGFKCDICGNTERTKMGHIPISGAFYVMSIRWILCEKCHESRWRPPESSTPFSFTYINKNSGESKKYQFRKPGSYNPKVPFLGE